jgi:hypothetical protein
MPLLRALFVLLAFAAFFLCAVALAAEVVGLADTGKAFAKPLGQIWREQDKDSLLLLQPAVERYIHPWLWEKAMFPLLLQPPIAAAGAFAALGFVLMLVARLFRRRR